MTPYCIFVILSLLLFQGTASAGTAPVSGIEVRGLKSLPQQELLDLLDIRSGAQLDRKLLREGIKRAFSLGIFTGIDVENRDNDESSLVVTVREKEIIDSISVKGNDRFSSGFIRKQIPFIDIGKRIHISELKTACEKLRLEMRKRGFPEADARYEIVPLKGNKVRIALHILEGPPQIIRKLVITEPEGFVRSEIELKEGDVFDSTEMERLAQETINHYKKQGYIKTKLTHSYTDGLLDISLARGRKIEISFEGQTALSAKALLQEVPFFDVNEFSDDLVEESTARIIAAYHKEGYPFAQVAPTISAEDDRVMVQYFIYEGKRSKLEAVAIEGVSSPLTIPGERLRDIIVSQKGGPYNPDQISSDRDTLADFYHALGYLSVEVMDPEVSMDEEKDEVRLRFRIKEGEQVRITAIELKGNRLFTAEELALAIPLKTGSPFNEVDISDSRRKIMGLYTSKGFLDAQISVKRNIAGTGAAITFEIQEGDVTLFGKHLIIGNNMTRQGVITREILHKEGEPLNYAILIQERQRLYRLGLFTDVVIEPAEEKGNKRDVKYLLKEADPGAVEFGIGYAEYERLRGFFGVSYKNLWGTGRQASFRTELSILEQRFLLSYYEPWFIGDIPLKALAMSEYREERGLDNQELWYKIRRHTLSAGIEKELSDDLKLEFAYDLSQVKTWDVKPDIVLSKEDVGTLIISGPRAGFIYDTRDNLFDPSRGILAGVSLKVASFLMFSQTDFTKLHLYLNNYHALSKRIVLATSVRGGFAKGFRSTNELPIAERFFLGGRTTVRGYEQDTLGPRAADGTPIGGNTFLMGNLELRFDLGKGIGLVTFLDAGNVWKDTRIPDVADLRYTTGLGLRYKTPVGPVRVDYGYKLNKEKGESVGELHFSLGQAF
ncbi:MAG: outer membrane protein assembly factor BamA [Thermodesulfovibrionales bacterium]